MGSKLVWWRGMRVYRIRTNRRDAMRAWGTFCGLVTLFLMVALGIWVLKIDDVARASIAAGHLLDWVTGGLCLVWLLVILKAPWDLYFQAQAVSFEFQRSRERG